MIRLYIICTQVHYCWIIFCKMGLPYNNSPLKTNFLFKGSATLNVQFFFSSFSESASFCRDVFYGYKSLYAFLPQL